MEGIVAAVAVHFQAHFLAHIQRAVEEHFHVRVVLLAGMQPFGQPAVGLHHLAVQPVDRSALGKDVFNLVVLLGGEDGAVQPAHQQLEDIHSLDVFADVQLVLFTHEDSSCLLCSLFDC